MFELEFYRYFFSSWKSFKKSSEREREKKKKKKKEREREGERQREREGADEFVFLRSVFLPTRTTYVRYSHACDSFVCVNLRESYCIVCVCVCVCMREREREKGERPLRRAEATLRTPEHM